MNGAIGESRPMNMIVIQYAIKNEDLQKKIKFKRSSSDSRKFFYKTDISREQQVHAKIDTDLLSNKY